VNAVDQIVFVGLSQFARNATAASLALFGLIDASALDTLVQVFSGRWNNI
jgi:ACR3 family arsenite efflux pump ArsB